MPACGLPGLLAYLLYPLIALYTFRRYSLSVAAISAAIFAEMYLPSGMPASIDLPLLPPIGKKQIAAVVVLGLIYVYHRKALMRIKPLRGLELIAFIAAFGWFGTKMINPEPLFYGRLAHRYPDLKEVVLPAITFADVRSAIIEEIIMIVIPFIIGRAAFQKKKDISSACNIIVAFGIAYIPIMILEMRLSPIFHTMVYGYYPHEFAQSVRWGGYRAQGFLLHGLVLGRYQLVAFMAAVTLYVAGAKKAAWFDSKTVIRIMVVVVIFTKSAGVTIFMVILGPLVLFSSLKSQARAIIFITCLVLAYPYIRAFKLIDIDQLTGVATSYSAQRGQSLAYRFRNERELSERAREKIWFGWGGYNRCNVWDVDYGVNRSVIDGYWVGRFGTSGVIGLIGPFALMLFPVLRVAWGYKKIPGNRDRKTMLAFAILPLIYAMECIPNAIFSNLPFILAGATWQLFSNLTNPKIIAAEKMKKAQQRAGYPPYPPQGYAPYPQQGGYPPHNYR